MEIIRKLSRAVIYHLSPSIAYLICALWSLPYQTRQLNLWGFKRELRGPDTDGERYFHEYFNRGKLDELQLIRRTEIKRRPSKKQMTSYNSSHALPMSHQIPSVSASQNDSVKIQGSNNPQRTGDITQGASFLTGLKGVPDSLRPNLLPGGGLSLPIPGPANSFNMQGSQPGQFNNMMSLSKTSSLHPSMQSQMMQSQLMQSQMMQSQQMMNSQMLQSQQLLMQQQMMRQPNFMQRYPTQPNLNSSDQLSREMLNQISNEQLTAMATMNSMNSMYNNGGDMNALNLLQSNPNALGCNLNDAHATLVSVAGPSLRGSTSGLSSSRPPQLNAKEEQQASDQPTQPVPRAA